MPDIHSVLFIIFNLDITLLSVLDTTRLSMSSTMTWKLVKHFPKKNFNITNFLHQNTDIDSNIEILKEFLRVRPYPLWVKLLSSDISCETFKSELLWSYYAYRKNLCVLCSHPIFRPQPGIALCAKCNVNHPIIAAKHVGELYHALEIFDKKMQEKINGEKDLLIKQQMIVRKKVITKIISDWIQQKQSPNGYFSPLDLLQKAVTIQTIERAISDNRFYLFFSIRNFTKSLWKYLPIANLDPSVVFISVDEALVREVKKDILRLIYTLMHNITSFIADEYLIFEWRQIIFNDRIHGLDEIGYNFIKKSIVQAFNLL